MVEYRVWCETGDLVGFTHDQAAATALLEASIAECAESCGLSDMECGVLNPHGFSIQEVQV